MISIIKHFSDFFEETEHFSGKMSIKVVGKQNHSVQKLSLIPSG